MDGLPIEAKLEWFFWAYPKPGDTVAELVGRLKAEGNSILEVDEKNQRVLIGKVTNG